MAQPTNSRQQRHGAIAGRAASLTAMLFLALAPAVSLGGAERSGTQDDWNRFTTPVFHELTTRNGLPHETISALAKDSSGILWIGTFGGVARWDGHRLRQFGNQSDDSTRIGDRYIRAILPLPGGGMLLGTNSGGLVRYDADRETFRTYRVGPGGTSHSKIFALAAARDGGVWIATDGGLDRWDPHRESISPVSLTLENGESATARLFTVLEDTQGNLWVGGNLGLAVRRAGRNTFERATSKDEPGKRILAGECWSLREDDKGRIWFGTGASGVAYATPDGVVTCPAALAEVPGMGLWRTVRSILQISPQRIWFGTDGAGIISYDPDSGQVERLAHDPAVPGTLNGDSIRAMLGDPHGNVWVGTHRGLERHDLSQRTVRSVFASPNNPRALSDSNVYSILSDPQGRVWAGLASGRLDILDLRSGNVTRLRLPAPHADRDVQALALGRDGSLLVGSLGVCRVDPITLTVTPSAIPCVDNKIVLFIGQDGADYLIGTYSGLYRYTPATGAWSASQANPKLPDALADDHVRVALRLPDGRLLVGTAGGISISDPGSPGYRNLLPNRGGHRSLPHGYITNLSLDARGDVWVGMSGGGIAIAPAADFAGTPSFRFIGASLGLPNPKAEGTVIDSDGNLWISTPTTLARVDGKTRQVRSIGEREGQAVTSYFIRSATQGPAGELLFGGSGGLSVVLPGEMAPARSSARLALTGLILGGKRVPTAWLPTPSKAIELPLDVRALEAEISLLDYRARSDLYYQARLEGLETDWTTLALEQPAVVYRNLPPGRHRLQIRALAKASGTRLAELEHPILVPPFWHETKTARGAALLAGLLLIVALMQGRTAWLRRRQRELEETVAARTRELLASKEKLEAARRLADEATEAKTVFLANMSHEFRTPLNGVIGYTELLRETQLTGKQEEMLRVVRDSGKALMLVLNDLLDVSQAEAGRMSLNPEPFTLAEVARGSARIITPAAAGKGLDLRVELAADLPDQVRGDAHRLRQVLLNLLGNAVKFTDRGSVTLSISRTGEDVRFEIRDTGIGIPADQMDRLFKRFSQIDSSTSRRFGGTGLGLAICKLIVDLMRGRIGVESTPGRETTFWFEVPLPEVATSEKTKGVAPGA